MVITNKLFTKIENSHLLVISTICALLISAFILPTSLIDVFSIGPVLWFKLVVGLFLIQSTIYYILKPVKKALIKFNIIDILILSSMAFVMLQSLILNVSYFKPLIFCLLTITYYVVKFFIDSIDSLDKKKFVFTIITIFSLVALLSSIIGISQMLNILPSNNLYFKVTGNFKNPARFATYLSSLLPIPFCFYVIYQTNIRVLINLKSIAGLSLLVGLLVLPSTYSRSAWLGLTVVIFLVFYLRYKAKFNEKFKNLSPIYLIGCVTFTVLFLVFLYLIKPQSANSRFNVWSISFPMFLHHPFFGIGYGQFEYQYDNFQALYFSSHDDTIKVFASDVIRYPYNIFLQVLYEQGLFGLTIFLLIILKSIPYYLFKSSYIISNKDIATISSFMGIVSILIGGMTSYPFDILPVQIIFYILLAILSSNNSTICWPAPVLKKSVVLPFNIIVLLGGCILIFNTFKEFQAYRLWKIAEENPKKMYNLEPIYEILKGNPDFLESYTATLLNNKEYQKVINICGRMNNILMYPSFYIYLGQSFSAQGYYYMAEKNYLFASNMIPNRFYPQYLLDKFYYDHHNYTASILVSKRILNMKIKVPSKTVDKVLEQAKIILNDSNKRLQIIQ